MTQNKTKQETKTEQNSPDLPGPAPPGGPPTWQVPVVFKAGTARAEAATSSLPASRHRGSPPAPRRRPRTPPLSLGLSPSRSLAVPHGRSRHGHTAENHRGQPLPRSISASPSSATTPWTYTPDARDRRSPATSSLPS